MDNMGSKIKDNFSLVGKTGLITGAAGLLGMPHATALLDAGASIILTDIDGAKLRRAKLELLRSFDSKFIHIHQMDVTSETSIRETYKFFVDNGIRIDILINNAAVNPTASAGYDDLKHSRLEHFSLNRWNHELSVGLTGAYLCSKIFGTAMAADGKGGVILNVSSDLSVIAPDQKLYRNNNIDDNMQAVKPITYSVVKTGLIGLTRYLSTYWPDKNIRVNALSPGGVENDQEASFIDRLEQIIPMGRMAKRDEYIGAVQFLCSNASAYMTGQNLIMDGGRSVI